MLKKLIRTHTASKKNGYKVAPLERVRLSTGDTIKIAREMLGITQAELALKTGLSPQHVSEIEADKIDIGKKRALVLSRALGIPAPFIMFPSPQFYQELKIAA